MSGSSPKKPTPVLTTPTSRSQQARSFLTSDAEEKQAEVTTAKPKASAANDRKQKAAARFMADHGITDQHWILRESIVIFLNLCTNGLTSMHAQVTTIAR